MSLPPLQMLTILYPTSFQEYFRLVQCLNCYSGVLNIALNVYNSDSELAWGKGTLFLIIITNLNLHYSVQISLSPLEQAKKAERGSSGIALLLL